ncbi:MAG: hypothetical protein H0W06_06500 [Chloroflexia bacterium]|nr:hypothetical protein [Chloroflexia bacterium]
MSAGSVAVTDFVLEEALYIRRVVEGEIEREPVDLVPLIASGALTIFSADSEAELQTFIDLTVDLDDGEAMTAALAIHRGCVLVTDDRKAERLLAGRVQLRATLELMRDWARTEGVAADEVRAALTGVYERGYQAPTRHPLKSWWDAAITAQ